MLVLMFALAARLVTRVVDAVAGRPLQFPAGPAGRGHVSLPTRSRKRRNSLITRDILGPTEPVSGRKQKISLLSGKFAAGDQNMPRPRMPSVGSRLASTRRPIRSRRVSVVP